MRGRAFVYGDNVDTDMLAPGMFMKFAIEELAKHCLSALDPAFVRDVRPGDIVVGGENFGMGSSREQAVMALRHHGVSVVVAKSFAGLFFRNAVNLGLAPLVCADAGEIAKGDLLDVDPETGRVENRTQQRTLACEPIPAHLMAMLRDGGLIAHLEKETESEGIVKLRERLKENRVLVAPGVYDGFTTLFAERAGFEAAYLSGASICYGRFALPDIGLVTATEAADTLAAIRERATIQLIVDIDTGFGNAANVQRTVRHFERNGANALQIEDQVTPKRCGHLKNKAVIPTGEMVGKIKAALDARRSADTLIVARTDAIAVEGFARALDRAEAYMAAGADVLFVEAPPDVESLAEVGKRFGCRIPVLANMVEGGRTPLLPAGELERLGFRIAIFPGGTARAVGHALDGYFRTLKAEGTTDGMRERMLDFAGINDVLGTDAILDDAKRYDS